MTSIIAPGNWDALRELAETHHRANLLDEVGDLYQSIGRKIGKSDCGLYREAANDKGMYAGTNALVGMLALLLGKNDEAERLYGLIKSEIGRDERDGLYRCQVGGSMSYADDNALVGAFACTLGRHEEAEELYETIKRKIGKGGLSGLYKAGSRGSCTNDNAAIGVLAFLLGRKGEAGALYERIKDKIGKRGGGLYAHSTGDGHGSDRYVHTHDNALMGMLAFLLDRTDEARALHESVGTEIGRGPSGLYRNSSTESIEDGRSSGSMGVLKCLLEGAKLVK